MSRIGRFDDEALARIRDAVAEAEARSSGEIVTYIVSQADEYPEAGWLGASVGAVVGLAAAYAFARWAGGWGAEPLTWEVGLALGSMVLGWALLQWLPPLRRWALARMIPARTVARAERAFLEEAVFATAGRTGVLLFIALFEHRVVILADKGIHHLVPVETWETLAEGVAGDLASGPDPEAVVAGVRRVGDVLVTAGLARLADDVDEIPDEPRFHER